ncbi:unnamed protein product [Sphagnum jensenii]|uniref:Phosphatidylinositol transfer protein N-terminal domain-containing protein n=1 Tax=Sphagnum jensenii TaxID=128206 RepID=A0ABP1BX91_9BRYO
MVQITEFRVVMPLSVEEYKIAQMYMVTKMQQQQTSGAADEGVEVLVNEPFENEEFGKGQFTSKIYHLQSKLPSWLAAFAPLNSMLIEEEAWNAYPKCKTGCISFHCPYFARFKLTIESIHLSDNGCSPNVHNLDADALALRKVETLDIGTNARDYWTYIVGGPEIDLTNFCPAKKQRGPLTQGWQETCDPVMTAYKLVTVDAPYWGFGYRLEQAALAGERSLFLESHKQCIYWLDEWCDLTFEDVRQLEVATEIALNQRFNKKHTMSPSAKSSDIDGLIVETSNQQAMDEANLSSSLVVRS